MLPALVSLSPPPPPLPQQPLVLETLEAAAATGAPNQQQRSATSSALPPTPASAGDGMNPSLLVVAAVVLFVFVTSASIHLLLRFLSRQPPSSSASYLSAPFVFLRRRLSSSSSSSSSSPPAAAASSLTPPSLPAWHRGIDAEKEDPIDWLPLFTFASSLATLPRSSPDCAVCLSRFHPDDQLRLLPSCRHAFHSHCIDTWLRSSLSCPLCRCPIPKVPLPPPPPPSPPAPSPHHPLAGAASDATTAAATSDRSGSYRIEIGCVSRRRTAEGDTPALQPNALSYSLGSSFEYVVEEEVEAVVAALGAHVRRQRQSKDPSDPAPPPPGNDVAESAGGGAGASGNWLTHYLDHLVSSASSSFSSLRFSGRDSRRIDAGSVARAGAGSWDLEGNRPWPAEEDEIAGAYNSFYRWLVGAYS